MLALGLRHLLLFVGERFVEVGFQCSFEIGVCRNVQGEWSFRRCRRLARPRRSSLAASVSLLRAFLGCPQTTPVRESSIVGLTINILHRNIHVMLCDTVSCCPSLWRWLWLDRAFSIISIPAIHAHLITLSLLSICSSLSLHFGLAFFGIANFQQAAVDFNWAIFLSSRIPRSCRSN